MIEETKKTKEELWKLYESLPDVLKDAIFSVDTAKSIENICRRNDIEEFLIPKLAKEVGNVLLGISHPERLKENLISNFSFEEKKAERISFEIYRFILFPLKKHLEMIYNNIETKGDKEIEREIIEEDRYKEKIDTEKDLRKEEDII